MSDADPLTALESVPGLPAGGPVTRPVRRRLLRRARPEPLLWMSDGPVGAGALASYRGHPALAAAGFQAVLLGERRGLEEWWRTRGLAPERMSDPGDHHAEPVLRAFWNAVVPDPEEGAEGEELIAPFGRDWPGLAAPASSVPAAPSASSAASASSASSVPAASSASSASATAHGGDPEAAAGALADELIGTGFLAAPRLALVRADRGADVPTAMGWLGPTNHENDTALLSAVLRSWEDRFGARVVALGFDELHLSVAAPPRTLAQALPVAAEHFAFCPDNVWQGSGTVRAYAEEAVASATHWAFWWD
ncbi:DUF4253 domain-containing protein [Streptomyces sp. NPDC048349]|uniref:DUF4253 domain-containing protein n=1 Tax=Streptomyces sp. NPDC048349 TaxID=3155486 RepID=UPI00341705C3